jgi:tetratricopeptide (TPR) repeat protein
MTAHIKSIFSRFSALTLASVSLFLFTGQSLAQNTEFRYHNVDDQNAKVAFWNNAFYDKARAQDIVFEKIAKLALEQGKNYFELVEPKVSTDFVATNKDHDASSDNVMKTKIGEPPKATREWSKSGTIVFPRYFFTTQVKFHEAPPVGSASKVYSARNVVLRHQYIEKPFTPVKSNKQSTASSSSDKSGSGEQTSEGQSEKNPVVAEWTNKSYQHLQKKEWVDAIRTASAAINLDANFDIAYVNRATAYIQHGYKEKAMTDIDTALALNPDNALAINMKGFLAQEKGANDEAMRFYSKACTKNLEIGCTNYQEIAGFRPDDKKGQADYFLNQSANALEKNRWTEAVDWASRAIEVDPDNYKAYANRAGALAEAGRAKEALLDADQAIALNPDFGPGYHNRGHAYKIIGNTRDAALEFEIGCGLGVKESCVEFKNINSVAKN